MISQSAISNKSTTKKRKANSKLPSKPKPSNRPRYSASPSPIPLSDGSEPTPSEIAEERAEMLRALESYQSEFLKDVLPSKVSGADIGSKRKKSKGGKGKGKEVVVKSIWEMDGEDFDNESGSEDDSEEEEEAPPLLMSAQVPRRAGPIVISFEEPRGTAAGTNKDMRAFMSSKVKNERRIISIADIANAKKNGKSKPAEANNTEEEAHLATLDTHLSDLLRPLTAPSTSTTHSQLPLLLQALPTTATKLKKGLTPLPVNTPRTLRRGQSAVNLKRAIGRDEASGLKAGEKGREAQTLREKRKEEGGDKRERGMKGAIGKIVRGGLVLSKEDIMLGSGMSSTSGRGGRDGRGRGGRGGSRGGGSRGGGSRGGGSRGGRGGRK